MYGYGYGAPPPAYGAPAPCGSTPPYGAPPPPNGPPPPAFGPPPSAYGAQPPPPYGTPAQAPQQPQPSAPSGGYPSLNAPPPAQVVPTDGNQDSQPSSHQRPSSAHPSLGGQSTQPSASAYSTRPASAYPYSSPPAYGAPASAPNPQPSTAPYTYGQPPAYTQGPPAAGPPPAYMPPTTHTPAPGHGGRRRRALLVGCSYPGSSAALNGCLNDVQCIQFCLQKRFGFTDQQILTLRDDPGRHHDFTSTKANIYRGIQWLMTDQQPGDSLFFHFSGHGSQQYDRNGDEEDGYDETICPSDFRSAGQIVDDELNRMVVRPLMPGVTLHAVVDACHSGTALDLPFRAKVDGAGRWYWKGRARHDKMTSGGTVFQFGACKDSQVAQDTKVLSGRAYTGAATYCFIEAIEKYGTQQTYGQVLSHMMATLRAATGAPGLNLGSAGSLIAGLLLGPAAAALTSGGQTPVLGCDKQVDLYATRLSL